MTLESLNKDNELQTIIKDLVRWGGRSIPPEESQVEDAVSEKQQSVATGVKIHNPSESNGVSLKDPLAVR